MPTQPARSALQEPAEGPAAAPPGLEICVDAKMASPFIAIGQAPWAGPMFRRQLSGCGWAPQLERWLALIVQFAAPRQLHRGLTRVVSLAMQRGVGKGRDVNGPLSSHESCRSPPGRRRSPRRIRPCPGAGTSRNQGQAPAGCRATVPVPRPTDRPSSRPAPTAAAGSSTLDW
jgi:hypothetical protein